jgi:2-oxoglutarate dehydrogenase dihydrolipoamide succinyltransferase (E2 component)
MATEVKLPDLGEGIESGDVVSLLVAPGDTVEAEQGLIELETDKATVEVPSPQAGTVAELLVAEGDTIKVGQPIVRFESDGQAGGETADEKKSDPSAKKAPEKPSPKSDKGEAEQDKSSESSDEGESPAAGDGQTVTVSMPEVGEGVEGGDVVSVLVSPGDQVQAEQGIAEIETDKATVEVPCPQAGTVTEVLIEQGQSIKVGQEMLRLQVAGGAGSAEKDKAETKPDKATDKQAPSPQGEPDQAEADQPQRPQAKTGDEDIGRRDIAAPDSAVAPATAAAAPRDVGAGPDRPVVPAGPATRRLARELGVDLTMVEGSGTGGRIHKDDVMAAVREMSQAIRRAPGDQKPKAAAAAEKPTDRPAGDQAKARQTQADSDAWGPVRTESMSKIRQTIARRMHESKSSIPHVTNFDDADVTDLEAFRQAHKKDFADSGVKLTMMPFVVKAVANSLTAHPVCNASVDVDAAEITYKQYVSIGIAVDTDRGLLVPVLRDADKLSIAQIAEGLAELSAKARDNDIALDDLRGGTFTISNLGAIGGTYSTPVINAPESAILLLGRSRKLPRVIDDRIDVRLMMPLSLSYDHRIVDGADAARFLNEVKSYLESPGKLLLTI